MNTAQVSLCFWWTFGGGIYFLVDFFAGEFGKDVPRSQRGPPENGKSRIISPILRGYLYGIYGL